MFFKKIEMQGFKSFADPVTIELNDGITCIVGPNGSGKSNISDALRWVLGEQSPKQLRGGKMEEVIFAGTSTRKPKSMAEVTLVIDNSDRSLPIEYNEVAVTRRMYRSGENEYIINGSQCRLRDIKELFMDTGIGVEGYSIIGQGKIAELVSTKPENRRQIFEEAAGVVLYKSRKADAERKLSSAEESLERVRDIIAEIEGRIGDLKEDSEKAQEYIKLRDRYRYLSVNIILHDVKAVEKNMNSSSEEMQQLAEELDSKAEELKILDEQIEQQRERESELNDQYESTNADLRSRTDELNTLSSRGQVNSTRLASIEKEIKRLKGVSEDNRDKLSREENNFRNLEQQEKELSAAFDAAAGRLKDAEFKLKEHTEKARIIDEQIEHNKDDMIDLGNKNSSRNGEINTLTNYLAKLEERRDQIKEDYQNRDQNDAESKSKLEDIQRREEENRNKIESAGREIADIRKKLENLGAKRNQIERKIADNDAAMNRTQARRSTIEEMENNYEGYNSAVRMLMQKKLPGIIGPVSDLIKVPDGYELAVETALGGQMQNIVCEDDSSAKNAVNWLKNAKAGRATFLPIRSMRPGHARVDGDVERSKGFLGIASEMVGCDSRYSVIVQYLLGRVIIADEMNDAVAISKKNIRGFRIVTLDGEVINASGAITGGRYRNKSANLLERRKEIDSLGVRYSRLRDENAELRNKAASIDSQIKDLKQQRYDIQNDVQKLDMEVQALAKDREHYESLSDAAGKAADKYNRDIENTQSDIERAESMIKNYRHEIEASQQKVSDLEAATDQLMRDSEKYHSLIDDDGENITKCRVDANEHETRQLGLNEMIERVRDTMQDYRDLAETAEEEMAKLEEEQELLTSSGEESGEKLKRLQSAKKQLEEKIMGISAEMTSNRERNRESLDHQKKCNVDLDNLQDRKHKLEVKQARYEAVMDAQKNKLWDEFEMSYAEAQDIRDEDFGITAGNKEVKDVKLRMAELGDINIGAIDEYAKVSRRYEFLTSQEHDTEKAMDELNTIISNMDNTIRVRFKENFDKVEDYFEKTFKELFGGGTAELRLEDENDPLGSGIDIIAQPPGKRLRNINLMSGGEKTLTGIALMFAVLKAKPTPFVILDEVEAALDEANIERFGNYLKNFKEIQFAIITHQKATMEHADVLYGVTMPEQGISRLLSLKLTDNTDEYVS